MVAEVERNERMLADDGAFAAKGRRDFVAALVRWLRRLTPGSLTSRIVLINIVGLIVLVAGILYFNQSRQSLIDARVQSLMTQGSMIASAVAGTATADTGSILIDPDRLLDARTGRERESGTGGSSSLEFLINPERAGPVLQQLISPTRTRARIYDREGILVVDSRYLYGRGEILRFDLPAIDRPPENSLSRLWKRIRSWPFTTDYPLQKEYGSDNGKEYPEIAAALGGASVSVVRVNRQQEIIVSVAVPIQRFSTVLGALVLSTQAGEIDGPLRAERQIILFTFLFATLVAALLAVLLAGTIAEPIRRLSAAAERVRRGVTKRVGIPDFTARRDEIGHLSGSLRDMTNALYNRLEAIEAFAADVAHELKNPLSSLRSAVETMPYARDEAARAHLLDIVKQDVKRLDRLITDISDASRLDAELARAEATPIDIRNLLATVVMLANEVRRGDEPETQLTVAPLSAPFDADGAYLVMGHDVRLGQVARNLLDNARSFSPPDKPVRVLLRRTADEVEFRVEDEGPGIRPENLSKIFERFHTDRPAGYFGKNSGLGLSISKQIVEAHRGRIWAENRYARPDAGANRRVLGARFTVRLPAASCP
jgi:two-component system sensor histidine kinase ChvG